MPTRSASLLRKSDIVSRDEETGIAILITGVTIHIPNDPYALLLGGNTLPILVQSVDKTAVLDPNDSHGLTTPNPKSDAIQPVLESKHP